jgi:heme oxygenase
MNNLKELTKEQHKKAEKSKFAKKLVTGNLTASEYACYLYNMWLVYACLETKATELGVLDSIEDICRTRFIYSDMLSIGSKKELKLKSSIDYIEYIKSISSPKKILAHCYVRHMGDLSGGQIIAKNLKDKFPVRFYEFEQDVIILKDKFREKLDDSMAPEATIAFDFAADILQEMDHIDLT